jgi:TPR repeat protein
MRHFCWSCLFLLSWQVSAADLAAGIAAIEHRDYAAALEQFRPLAAAGNVAAQLNLGNLYFKGMGIKQDYAEALRWFHLAADQNEPMAWSKLGVMHYYGLGVDKDTAEAARWFRKAAERGDAGAQTVLASLFAQGDGIRRDPLQAYYWYSRAAELGNEDGAAGRDSMEDEITPGEKDEALRMLAESRKQQQLAETPLTDAKDQPDAEPAATAALSNDHAGRRHTSKTRKHRRHSTTNFHK